MTALADLFVKVRADTTYLARDLKKEGVKSGKTFGTGFSGAFKNLIGGAAVFTVLAGATSLLKDASLAARESWKVGRQTQAVLKSTGGAAKVTQREIEGLAQAISAKTGIDDEAIQSSANMLLTFTNVRNEVGKGNDIFTQATKTVQDMSVALGQDGKTSAIQLGKALNDPIAGVSALRRVGVTFTEQQKEQIKTLVEHGNKLGAQKIILAELSKEFGGSAAAQATWADKAKVAFENVQETVGGFLNKTLEPVAKWFTEVGAPAIQDFFEKISTDKALKTAVQNLKDALTTLTGDQDFKQALTDFATAIPPVVQGLADIVTKYGEIATAVDKFENSSFGEGDKTGGPVGRIIKDFGAGGTIEQALIQFRGFVGTHAKSGWATVTTVFREKSAMAASDVGRFKDRVVGFFQTLGTGIKTRTTGDLNSIKTSWRLRTGEVATTVSGWKNRVVGFFQGLGTSAKTQTTSMLTSIANSWRIRTASISATVTGWKNTVLGIGRSLSVSLQSTTSTMLNKIVGSFSTAKNNIGRVWAGVKDVAAKPINWIKDNVYNKPLVPVWNRVAALVSGPKLSAYASGGVEGVRPGYTPGRDTHPIMVSGGEAIMRPEWTRVVGKNWIDQANAAARRGVGAARNFIGDPKGMPGFQTGGVVGWMKGLASNVSSKVGNLKDWVLGGLRAAAGKVLDPVKALIGKAMPSNGVGTTVGNIGKKVIDLVLDKIHKEDVLPTPMGPAGSAIASGGWASIYRALRAVGARSFTTYAGHDQGASRSRDVWPASAGNRVAEVARRLSSVWYVIWNRRIASITTGRRWIPYRRSNPHTDHVHITLRPGVKAMKGGIANFDNGGVFKPGLNLGYNGTGRDELLRPVRNGRVSGGAATIAARPITILIDLGDGLVQKVQGLIDENDEFRATVGRTR